MRKVSLVTTRTALALGVATVSAALVTTPARGAEALEEIIVTAQKREENVLEVPVAITVVGADQLSGQRVYGLADLARTAPALEMIQAFGGPGGGGTVRGIGTQSFTRSAEGAVGVVVDGVAQGNVPMNALFDLERVEILKGPQGTLFGLTTSAGVINMTTVAPDTGAFSGYLQADYSPTDSAGSEFGQETFRGAVNIPLTENAALRIVGSYDKVEGVQYDANTGKDDEEEETALRGRFLWQATDAVTINLIADYSERDRNIADPRFNYVEVDEDKPLYSELAECGITPSEDNNGRCLFFDTESKFENYGFSGQIDIAFDAGTLTSITGYRKQEEGPSSFDIMANPLDHDQIYNTNAFSEGEQVSQEFRFNGETEKLEYTVGAYFYKYDAESGYRGADGGFFVGIPSLPPFLPFCKFNDKFPGVCHVAAENRSTETSNESYALFGQGTWHLNEHWSVLAGLRYTDQEIEDFSSENTLEPGLPESAPTSGKTSENNVSGKLGATYTMEEGTMVFATFTRGYKGPQVIPSAFGESATVIDPEIPEAWELGAKGIIADAVGYEASLFYTDVQDYQGQRCRINSVGVLDCVGESVSSVESKGVELNFFGNVTDNLRLSAGYIYVQAEYPDDWTGFNPEDLRDPVPGTMIGQTDLGGKQVVGVPEHKFVTNVDYRIPLGSTELVLGGDAVYKSDIRLGSSGDDRFVYGADWTLSARVGLVDQEGRWSLELFGRNLTENREPATLFGGPSYVAPFNEPNGRGYVNGISGWTTKAGLRQVGLSAKFYF